MEDTKQGDVVTIKTYNDTVAATIALQGLKENGVEAFIENENVVGLNPLGGVELKVFAKDIVRAGEILAAQ